MSFTIYGFRLRADAEVRYVGLTYKKIERRFREHLRGACVPHLSPWLRENLDRVEVFAIASVDDRLQAKATEKVIITLCARLGHRLFNRTHVPKHLLWDSSTNSRSPVLPVPATPAACASVRPHVRAAGELTES
jgi:hypothetical protein